MPRVAVLTVFAAVWGFCNSAPCEPPPRAFDLQGHRGARGLAPENTMAAFRRALAIGVTTIETDVAVTKDLVAVISHDPHLNPNLVRNAQGVWLDGRGPAISALTYEELRTYDIGRVNPLSDYAKSFPSQVAVDGERFPKLSELFALLTSAPAVRANIETKITPGNDGQTVDVATFARVVLEDVRQAGVADRVTIQSFDWRSLIEVKKLAPEMQTSCLTMSSRDMDTMVPGPDGASPWHAGLKLTDHGGSIAALVKAAGCSIWSPLWRNVTPALIDEAHRLGVKVVPWTVNDTAEMQRLIDAGVDGLITDYPDRLRALLQRV